MGHFSKFRTFPPSPASAASDVGLTLKTRLNTLKQPRENFATNQLAGKGKNLADPKGKKILVQKKGKIFGRKKWEKNFDQSAGRKKGKKFWPKKGKILMKNFKG